MCVSFSCIDSMCHLLHSLYCWLFPLFSVKMFCAFFPLVTIVCICLVSLSLCRLIDLMVLDNPWWRSEEPEFLILADGASLYCLRVPSLWTLTSQRPTSFVDGRFYGAKHKGYLSLSLEKSWFFWFPRSVYELSAKQRVPVFLGDIVPSERMALKPFSWQTCNPMTNLESRREQLGRECCLLTWILRSRWGRWWQLYGEALWAEASFFSWLKAVGFCSVGGESASFSV